MIQERISAPTKKMLDFVSTICYTSYSKIKLLQTKTGVNMSTKSIVYRRRTYPDYCITCGQELQQGEAATQITTETSKSYPGRGILVKRIHTFKHLHCPKKKGGVKELA